LEKDRAVPYVINNIIIHMIPDGSSDGGGERERIGMIVHQVKTWTCS
jgi:hypothetical protein